MSKFLIVASLLGLVSCNQDVRPTLNCKLQELSPRLSPDTPAKMIGRTMEAKLSERSEGGVWQFQGTITSPGNDKDLSYISGSYYQNADGSIDFMARTSVESFTVMPSNPFLKERGLQGVVMLEGQTVSTGRPLTASCQVLVPESK